MVVNRSRKKAGSSLGARARSASGIIQAGPAVWTPSPAGRLLTLRAEVGVEARDHVQHRGVGVVEQAHCRLRERVGDVLGGGVVDHVPGGVEAAGAELGVDPREATVVAGVAGLGV